MEKRRETTQEEDDDEAEEDVTIPEVINALKIVRKFSQKILIKEVNALRAIENKCFSDTVSNKKQLSIKSFFNLL